MPGPLNVWYERLTYHKILPLEYILSTRISRSRVGLASPVLSRVQLNRGCEVRSSSVCDNFLERKFESCPNTKSFAQKLKQELPGLAEPPFDTDLGKKVYEQISQKAWDQWMEYCKMLLNEYRLNPARKQDQEVIVKQMEQFFFGEGAAPPAQYVPPSH